MIGHDYPYLDTRDLNLDWVLKNMKKIINDWAEYQVTMNQNFDNLEEAFDALKSFVDNFFDTLDLSGIVDEKLEEMKENGELDSILASVGFKLYKKGGSRYFLIIGDSYSDPNRGGFDHGWASVAMSCLNRSFGSTAFIHQLGGAGFVGAGQGKTFEDLLDDAIADASISKPAITDIVVAGGCNDKNENANSITTAVYNFAAKARGNYPNATVWVACIGGFVNVSDEWHLAFMERVYQTACQYNWVNYIYNGLYCMSTNECFDTDGIHPTYEGCMRIGRMISGALESRGGIVPYNNYYQLSITNYNSAGISYPYGGAHPFYMADINGGRYLGLKRHFWIQLDTAAAVQNDMSVYIGSFNTGFIMRPNLEGTNYLLPAIDVPVNFQESGKNYYVTGYLKFTANSENRFVMDVNLILPFVPEPLVGKSVSLISLLAFTRYLGI